MPAPTLNQIRAAIKAKIESVPDRGVVHEYEPYFREPSKLLAKYQFGAPARIFGWHIRRVGTRELLDDIARWHVFHSWRIRGFMGIEEADETEKLFDTKIELIRDAFRADDSLGNLLFDTTTTNAAGPKEIGIQVLQCQPVMFCNALCHHAELGLTTQHLN